MPYIARVDNPEEPIYFTKELGHKLYRRAVEGTPWDTGNLAHSIKTIANTPTFKKYKFSSSEADYVEALEEGTSSHGKHKGFIKDGILIDMIYDIIWFFQYDGKVSGAGGHDRRRFLSSQAKIKGYGKGKVTVGRSRWSIGETRNTRRMSSLARQRT